MSFFSIMFHVFMHVGVIYYNYYPYLHAYFFFMLRITQTLEVTLAAPLIACSRGQDVKVLIFLVPWHLGK